MSKATESAKGSFKSGFKINSKNRCLEAFILICEQKKFNKHCLAHSFMAPSKTFYGKSESFAVQKLKREIPASMKKNLYKKSKGFFAELYENPFDKKSFISCGVDGVGSKALIASLMNKYDTIGQDLVAMNANDLASIPMTKPFLFLNYIAAQDKILEKGITAKIMKGIVKGLRQADANKILNSNFVFNLGKGETAFMNELIADQDGFGFDLAGAMIGFVEKKYAKINVKPGMDIIALKSSGIHSNGMTVARHLLLNGRFEKSKKFRKLYKGKFGLNYRLPN